GRPPRRPGPRTLRPTLVRLQMTPWIRLTAGKHPRRRPHTPRARAVVSLRRRPRQTPHLNPRKPRASAADRRPAPQAVRLLPRRVRRHPLDLGPCLDAPAAGALVHCPAPALAAVALTLTTMQPTCGRWC